MKKVTKLLKLVHLELSDCFAEFPAMMWVALFLDCLLVLYMLLLGVDGILFPSRMTTLRMVIGGYGVVNTIFLLIAGYVVIGEASPERESCPEDRLERYQNIIASAGLPPCATHGSCGRRTTVTFVGQCQSRSSIWYRNKM